MSIPKRIKVNCPKCGKQINTTIFESVNTDFSPDLAASIISGELFSAHCPKCGNTAQLEYDLLYHDMKHGAMIWVIHKSEPDYQTKIAEARATKFILYKTTRIVFSMDGLREKVSCLEAGKDDRIVELCKMYIATQVMQQQPDFTVNDVYYTYSDGKDIVFIYGANGQKVSCYLKDELYNAIESMYQTRLSQASSTPYQVIDSTWANSFFSKAQG